MKQLKMRTIFAHISRQKLGDEVEEKRNFRIHGSNIFEIEKSLWKVTSKVTHPCLTLTTFRFLFTNEIVRTVATSVIPLQCPCRQQNTMFLTPVVVRLSFRKIFIANRVARSVPIEKSIDSKIRSSNPKMVCLQT